ncbi:hypothetical protein HID58_017718 [Brassica napus]|uniref:Uncharacterized protein n=1 Tax=Brassica napus TaxID=3708 RepID=A0ABQ8D917_BRANA|nr:hypothetical protein HID58_017718 [Brassica napus]
MKEKADHLQGLKDTVSKFEEGKERLYMRYEQQRKKEKTMISEQERFCTEKIAQLEESLNKKETGMNDPCCLLFYVILPTAVLALYRSIFIHTIQTVQFVIFVLHETCDSLPRKLRHELHKHTLILRPKNNPDEEHGYNLFNSPVCQQLYSGFKYVSSKSCDVQIDVRCVLQLRRRSTMKAIRIISYTLPPQKPSFVVLVELKHPLY